MILSVLNVLGSFGGIGIKETGTARYIILNNDGDEGF